jgi:hypothetical protein
MSTTTTTGAWVAGYNQRGYLPELDELPAFATRDAAWTWLVDEMRRYADQEDESVDDVDAYQMRSVVDSTVADASTDRSKPGDWSCWIEDQQGYQVVFWLRFDVDATPDED